MMGGNARTVRRSLSFLVRIVGLVGVLWVGVWGVRPGRCVVSLSGFDDFIGKYDTGDSYLF